MHRDPAASSGFRVSGSSAFALSRDKANANHAHDAMSRRVSGDPLPSGPVAAKRDSKLKETRSAKEKTDDDETVVGSGRRGDAHGVVWLCARDAVGPERGKRGDAFKRGAVGVGHQRDDVGAGCDAAAEPHGGSGARHGRRRGRGQVRQQERPIRESPLLQLHGVQHGEPVRTAGGATRRYFRSAGKTCDYFVWETDWSRKLFEGQVVVQ